MQPYSPDRRTALILCGTGAHGAYHAGVLRAFQETGVRIDVAAGHGIGAAGAALAAIDGAARTWEEGGIWRRPDLAQMYSWRWPLRAAAWTVPFLLAASLAVALLPATGYLRFVAWLPALALAFIGVLAGLAVAADWRRPSKRRARGAWWWRQTGSPIDARQSYQVFSSAIWQMVRGGDASPRPSFTSIGARYADVLAESLGQPGFRELLIVATDLDSRRDIVAGMLQEPYRREFLAAHEDAERRTELLDLAGAGREHAFDVVAGALTPPGCEPFQISFGAESHWRGETHRLCSRPGSIGRLLEEVAAAGVSQAILVSGVAPSAGPHQLAVPGMDLRDRLGDFIAASEATALRDAMTMARLRFDSVYLICPSHNAVGPFDLAGAYDDASDRRQTLVELMERAYEDAYRQFVEPVIGASGDDLARRAAAARQSPGQVR